MNKLAVISALFSLWIMPVASRANAHPVSAQHVLQVLETARSPAVSRYDQYQAAKFALRYLRTHTAGQMEVLDDKELLNSIIKNPTLLTRLELKKTKGTALVATELSSLIKQMAVGQDLNSCGTSGSLTREVLGGMARYKPCLEGQYNYQVITLGQKKEERIALPNYLYSDNLDALITVAGAAGHYSIDEIGKQNHFVPTPDLIRKTNPTVKTDQEVFDIASMADMVGDTYLRAVQGSIRNKISLLYRYGKIKDWESAVKKIDSDLVNECKHCSAGQKVELGNRVKNILRRDIGAGDSAYRSPSTAAERLCGSLRNLSYPFDGEPEEKNASIAAKHSSHMINTASGGGSQASTANYKLKALEEKRQSILGTIAHGSSDGLLVLTESLTELNKQKPGNIRLKCTEKSKREDESLIRYAIEEGIKKTDEFSDELHYAVSGRASTREELSKELTSLLKLAPQSVGEGLQSNTDMRTWVCNGIKKIEEEKLNDKRMDQLMLWGSMIAGGGLTLTGFGAPFGSTIMYTSLAGGLALNLGAAGYEWRKSKEAKELAELYRTAAIGQGGDKYLMDVSEEEFKKYTANRLSAMINLGLSSTDIAAIVRVGIKSGKTLSDISDDLLNRLNSKSTVKGMAENPFPNLTLKKVQDADSETRAALDKLGIKYSKIIQTGNDDTKTMLERRITSRGKLADKSEAEMKELTSATSLYKITAYNLPKPGKNDPNELALLHPEFPTLLKKIEEKGYNLAIDPTVPLSRSGAYFHPPNLRIAISQESTWTNLVHEFQHLEFDQAINKVWYQLNKMDPTGKLNSYEDRMTDLDYYDFKNLKPQEIETYNQSVAESPRLVEANLLRKKTQLSEEAVNETLAVRREIEALKKFGYSKLGETYYELRAYALDHQIQSLQALSSLTEIQKQTLRMAQIETLVLEAIKTFRNRLVQLGVAGTAATAYVGYNPKTRSYVIRVGNELKKISIEDLKLTGDKR